MIHVSVLSERVSRRRFKAKAGRYRDTDVRLDEACVHLLIRRKDGGLETLGLGRRGMQPYCEPDARPRTTTPVGRRLRNQALSLFVRIGNCFVSSFTQLSAPGSSSLDCQRAPEEGSPRRLVTAAVKRFHFNRVPSTIAGPRDAACEPLRTGEPRATEQVLQPQGAVREDIRGLDGKGIYRKNSGHS